MKISEAFVLQLKDAALAVGKGCDFGNCKNVSLGFICTGCSKKLCNGHLYFKIESLAPPQPICAGCIFADHEHELLEDL